MQVLSQLSYNPTVSYRSTRWRGIGRHPVGLVARLLDG
jgi:hypothetical protein